MLKRGGHTTAEGMVRVGIAMPLAMMVGLVFTHERRGGKLNTWTSIQVNGRPGWEAVGVLFRIVSTVLEKQDAQSAGCTRRKGGARSVRRREGFEGGMPEGRRIDHIEYWRGLDSVRGKVPLQAASLHLQSQLARVCARCSPVRSHSRPQGVGRGPGLTEAVT